MDDTDDSTDEEQVVRQQKTEDEERKKGWINPGKAKYDEIRAQWTKQASDGGSGQGSAESAAAGGSGASSNAATAAKKKQQQQAAEGMADFDAEQVIGCLRNYQAFPQPIPLSTMVEILTVLWDDEAM
jgi:hypothetical protein